MKVIVIADSHGMSNRIARVIEAEKDLNVLIHLGDGLDDLDILPDEKKYRLLMIKGNEDVFSQAPQRKEVRFYGLKVLLTHGDTLDVKHNINVIINYGIEGKYNIVLFGHTHEVFVKVIEGILFLNPGALVNSNYAVLTITKETLSWEIKRI
jgi:putative phosphoesterase